MIRPHLLSAHRFKGLRIGLLGGSFNPAHAGHLAMSVYALKRLGLDQIWWLVTPQNPLKSKSDMAPLEVRIKNAENMAHHKKIIVTDIERELGTRYTVDTLKQLKKRFPKTDFVWLMGADNLEQMPRWQKWAEIFHLVPVAVFRRPAYASGRDAGKAAQRFERFRLPVARASALIDASLPAWVMLDNVLNKLSGTVLRNQK